MKPDHIEYLINIKADGSLPSTDIPASVVSNLVIRGPQELSGQYLVYVHIFTDHLDNLHTNNQIRLAGPERF